MRALLEMGCDPELKDELGRTAADLAEQRWMDSKGRSAVAEMVMKTLRQATPSASKVMFSTESPVSLLFLLLIVQTSHI